MLYIFETFLALVLGRFEDKSILTRLWEDFIKDELSGLSASTVNKYLKREIIE